MTQTLGKKKVCLNSILTDIDIEKIVYQDEKVVLLNGDCRELVGNLHAKFDLVFTDPPFNLEMTYDYVSTMFGKCKGHCFVMHNERHLARLIAANDKYFSRMYAIDTVVPNLVSNKAPMQLADFIAEFRFSKTKFINNGDCFSNLLRIAKIRNKKNISKNFDKKTILPGTFIQNFSNEGDIIFDPFAGSCSTLVAAKITGRYAIGIEKYKGVCMQAEKILKIKTLF